MIGLRDGTSRCEPGRLEKVVVLPEEEMFAGLMVDEADGNEYG